MTSFGRRTTVCPECGAGVRDDARFCSECGTDLAAGPAESGTGGRPSLTDEILPGAAAGGAAGAAAGGAWSGEEYPTDEQPAYDPAEHPYGGEADDHHPAAPDPSYTEPQYTAPDPSYTEPQYTAPPHDPAGLDATQDPYDDTPAGYGAGTYDDRGVPVESDRRRSGGLLFPALVGLVVVLLLVAGWLIFLPGGDDSDTAAPPAPSASQSPSQSSDPGTSAPESPSPSASESPSTSPSPSPSDDSPQSISLPSDASRCEDIGGGVTAYSGNDVTSCPFAVSTARNLVSDDPTLPATIDARSPVTEEDYALDCENTAPVRCTGGDNAVVYVEIPE